MADLYFARQPIFDAEGRVWGYELLYRSTPEAEAALITDPDESTLKVAAAQLVSPDHDFTGTNCVLNVTGNFLLAGYAQGLDAQRMVLRLTPEEHNLPGVAQALEELRQEGFCSALGPCPTSDCLDLDLNAFDYADVRLPVLQDEEARERVSLRLQKGPNLLASFIETHPEQALAAECKAALFQGFYYQHPKNYSVDPLPAGLIHRLKILQVLEAEDGDIRELAKAVEADPALSMRLIQFVNSATFALVRKVDSVRQAIALTGWNRLRNWLRLLTVSQMNPPDQTRELAYTAALRAKVMELTALYSGRVELADSLYLLGLFSLLEPMLGRPMADILAEVSINAEVADALLGKPDGLSPWLKMVHYDQAGDWLNLDLTAAKLDIDLHMVTKAKLEAMAWAKDFFKAAG